MTVTAVLNQDQWQVAVTITDLPVLPAPGDPWPATPWTLSRSDGLTEQPVRAAFERPLVAASSAVVRDREYPISRPFLYVLRYVDAVDGQVTLYSNWIEPAERELPRISNPITGEGVDATIVQWPDLTSDSRASVFDVDGRPEPYVITAPMSSPTSQMVLRTLDATSWRTLYALLRRGQVIQVRASVPFVDDAYVLPSRYVMSRMTNRAADTRRIHTLDVTQTGQPSPNIVASGTTLQDLADAYPGGTLADIAADFDFLYEIAAAPL